MKSKKKKNGNSKKEIENGEREEFKLDQQQGIILLSELQRTSKLLREKQEECETLKETVKRKDIRINKLLQEIDFAKREASCFRIVFTNFRELKEIIRS